MEFKPKATMCAVILMLLLLSSYEGGSVGVGVAEARLCTGKSQDHSFLCMSDKRCYDSCVKEQGAQWTAGSCHRRRCVCQKAC